MGHLTTLAALPGIAIGVAAVEYGPLGGIFRSLKGSHVIESSAGGSVTLSSLTGLPFWVLALIFAVLTLGVALRHRRAHPGKPAEPAALSRACTRSWKPWKAGIAIGLLGAFAYLSSAASGRNYPLGVTHGVLHAQLLLTESGLTHVWRKPSPPAAKLALTAKADAAPASPAEAAKPAEAPKPAAPAAPQKKVVWWLIVEVLALVAGAWFAARLAGQAKLYPKPPEQIVIAFFGGLLVGAGAAFAEGCVVGNILSGWGLMSVGMFAFAAATILGNWIVTYFYLLGGSLFGSD